MSHQENSAPSVMDTIITLLSLEPFQQGIEQIARHRVLGGIPGNAECFNLDRLTHLTAALTSADYMMKNMHNIPRFQSKDDLHRAMLRQSADNGLYLEFGVFSGWSINLIAEQKQNQTIYGFDSFEGLPEPWREGYNSGHFSMTELPEVRKNVTLIKGWFDRTLPEFLDLFPDSAVAYLHVDCDLYSSTVTIFNQLRQRIVPGTIVLFDEYFNYPTWERHEFKAFQEFIRSSGFSYAYRGVVPSHQQVAVQILG